MSICNIIANTNAREDQFIFYTDDIKNIKNGIPTLIIGWEKAKQLFKETKKLSILDKKIDDNLFWTFSKTENRVEYEVDMSRFIKIAIEKIEKNIEYEYINILTTSYNKIKKLLEILYSNNKSYIYIKNNSFVYIFNRDIVYGIDLNSIDYLCINRKKIYKKLYGLMNDVFFSTDFINKNIINNITNSSIIPKLKMLSTKKNEI